MGFFTDKLSRLVVKAGAIERAFEEGRPDFAHPLMKITADIRAALSSYPLSGKRVYIEMMDGKYDGLILDGGSSDPTERAMVEVIESSYAFDVVECVETDTEAWVQLRPAKF